MSYYMSILYVCRKSYAEKNKIREKENDILEVERLNNWKPAPDVYARAVLQDI